MMLQRPTGLKWRRCWNGSIPRHVAITRSWSIKNLKFQNHEEPWIGCMCLGKSIPSWRRITRNTCLVAYQHSWLVPWPILIVPASEKWLHAPSVDEPSTYDPEVAPVRWTETIPIRTPHRLLILAKDVSDLHRFIRIIGWLLRFVCNYPSKGNLKSGIWVLSAQEIRDAMVLAIQIVQNHFFYRELATIKYKRDLPAQSRLSPLIDTK